MPTEFRFDDLDLREEPASVAKLDQDQDSAVTTCITICRCTPPPPLN